MREPNNTINKNSPMSILILSAIIYAIVYSQWRDETMKWAVQTVIIDFFSRVDRLVLVRVKSGSYLVAFFFVLLCLISR